MAFFMTACEEEIPSRDLSPATNPNSANVYFSGENNFTPVLGIEDDNFDIIINREKTDEELTVPLTVEAVNADKFEIPTSVTFAAGEGEKVINIKVKDLELMKKYHLSITVDVDQTLPYKEFEEDDALYGRLELIVLKEDFAPYAEGNYSSEFFEETWPATLEYSPATDVYRFKDCWMPGYDVTFKWDGSATVSMIGSPTGDFIVIPTGYVHLSYGMINAYYYKDDVSYDEASKTFEFWINWRVSAGTFGDYPDSFEITQVL
jgi:hypothetical protein